MNSVFNAGATLLPDGTTLLLWSRGRIAWAIARFLRARTALTAWQIDREPKLLTRVEKYPEEFGIEDQRVPTFRKLKQYAKPTIRIRVAVLGVSLALTKDFREDEREWGCNVAGRQRCWRSSSEDQRTLGR